MAYVMAVSPSSTLRCTTRGIAPRRTNSWPVPHSRARHPCRRATQRALVPPVQASSSAAARGGVAPWLPPIPRDGNKSKVTALGRWLVALSAWIALPLNLLVFTHIFWHQASLEALLGSKLQVLLLLAAPVMFAYAAGAGVLQHEYEGFQVTKAQDWGSTATGEYRTNRWLRELTARQYTVAFCWGLICFAAAAFGLTPTVLGVAAACTIAFAGPYAPLVDPVVNGEPILMVSACTLLGFVPATVLTGMALWKLFGTTGMLLLAHLLTAVGLETAAEITKNDFVHTLSHAMQFAFFPLVVFMLTGGI